MQDEAMGSKKTESVSVTADNKGNVRHRVSAYSNYQGLTNIQNDLKAKLLVSSAAATAESFTDYWLIWSKNMRQVHGRSLWSSLTQSIQCCRKTPMSASISFTREYLKGSLELCIGTVPFVIALELKEYYIDRRFYHNTLYSDFCVNTMLGASLINASEKLRVGNIYSGRDFTYNFTKNIVLGKLPARRLFDGALSSGLRDGASMTAAICGLDCIISKYIRNSFLYRNLYDLDHLTIYGEEEKLYNQNADLLGRIGAAFVGTTLSHPADVIGTRAQLYSLQGKQVNYPVIIQEMWLEGGYRFFTRGFLSRYSSILALNVFYGFYKNKFTRLYDELYQSDELYQTQRPERKCFAIDTSEPKKSDTLCFSHEALAVGKKINPSLNSSEKTTAEFDVNDFLAPYF